MPVYPVAPQFATGCPSRGCWCHDRGPRYPSDLSDDQWKVLEPQARAVMKELVTAAGRPMAHDLRAMVDAVAYVARNGIEWRAMPADFPRWDSVYAFYQRWNARRLPQHGPDGCGPRAPWPRRPAPGHLRQGKDRTLTDAALSRCALACWRRTQRLRMPTYQQRDRHGSPAVRVLPLGRRVGRHHTEVCPASAPSLAS